MREIKFRAYCSVDKTWHYWTVYESYPQGIYGGLSEPQQYTGLKDANGTDIYEGDILNGKFTVEFLNGRFRFIYMEVDCGVDPKSMQITGTIFDKSQSEDIELVVCHSLTPTEQSELKLLDEFFARTKQYDKTI